MLACENSQSTKKNPKFQRLLTPNGSYETKARNFLGGGLID